jgi:hypothetical protein
MSNGHKSGRKTTKRSLKVLPPPFFCEMREEILESYRRAEEAADDAKRLNIFRQLDAHEQKHGCGRNFLWKSD